MRSYRTASFRKRLVQWSLVCSVCAVPSALVAWQKYHPAGMVSGVAVFILALALATSRPTFTRFESLRGVGRTLRLGIGLRVIVSVALPAGIFIDVWPGFVSIGLIELTPVPPESIFGTFLITIVQGALLNLILLGFLLPIYPLVRAMTKPEPADPNACPTCGYDVRASRVFGRCPECGGEIPPEQPGRADGQALA